MKPTPERRRRGPGLAALRVLSAAGVLVAVLSACAPLPPPPNQVYGAPVFDRSTRTLWLRGQDYYVPPSVGTLRLDDAAMITVTWEQEGGRRVVRRYFVEERSDVSPLPLLWTAPPAGPPAPRPGSPRSPAT